MFSYSNLKNCANGFRNVSIFVEKSSLEGSGVQPGASQMSDMSSVGGLRLRCKATAWHRTYLGLTASRCRKDFLPNHH